ncbi:DnaJ-like protein subfamily C member 17 [Geosmithia morbida]|uniref:DnaJ-like protein subfamily C member 17 n=1 Tax=Geosmithia morbida TaxID=1094350 RepID=A0A9P4YUK0_9HYPO|nr:DnaJ-like protein subfamily C member 17 [Geosmithia morbida]KAF4121289.1 DnaJ-like protein subfamily C member 17 [Geosmithia morbida]
MADDNKADLVRFASEYADKDIDLFDLLGIDALTPKADIHRAWRKRSLKYHPDKAGEAFDASKWELFERARDVLSDESARLAYEQATKSKLLRRQERDALDRDRRRYADELEAAERAARQEREAKTQKDREAMDRERARLAEAQRMRDQEIKRQAEAEQEHDMLAEARRRVRERKEEKARRKMAKETNKAAGRPAGVPVNGVVLVPGDYVADLPDGDASKKQYWELVCDKLRAVQAARNLAGSEAAADDIRSAEASVHEARQRISLAEDKYRQETAA